jgi:integrase
LGKWGFLCLDINSDTNYDALIDPKRGIAMASPVKTGRKNHFVQDEDGADIKGLSVTEIRDNSGLTPEDIKNKKKGRVIQTRYYATWSNPRVWFGSDKVMAIQRFYAWQSRQQPIPETESIQVDFDQSNPMLVGGDENRAPVLVKDVIDKRLYWQYDIPSDALYQKIGNMIRDPDQRSMLARKIGVMELINLPDLQPPAPSMTLQEIWDLYQTKTFADRDESKRSKTTWDDFVDGVGVKSVKQVTETRLIALKQKMKARNLSPKTVKNYYNKMASIIKYAIDHRKQHRPALLELKSDFRRICTAKDTTKKKGKRGNAKPIDIDDFAFLFKAGSEKIKAIALCMLNFAMHPSEATSMRKTDINFVTRQLRSNRTKTGEVERVAMVWQETIDQIHAYQKLHKDNKAYQDSEYLFLTDPDIADPDLRNKPYRRGGLIDYFRETWKPRAEKLAGRKINFTLDSVRDGAQNAADDGGADSIHTEMLMGHVLPGEMEKYKTRTPKKTEKSVTAIHEHYKIAELVKSK